MQLPKYDTQINRMRLSVVPSFEKLLCFPIIEVMVLYSAKHKKSEAVCRTSRGSLQMEFSV